jgi:hypothetical protein
MKYLCANKVIIKKNLHENKSKINRILKDMDCNLSINHAVSLSVWRNIICPAIVSKDVVANPVVSSMDSICWRASG